MGATTDEVITLTGVRYITFKEDNNTVFVKLSSVRFNFDSANELIDIIPCSEFSHDSQVVPNHGNYDIYIDEKNITTVYEYLTDKNGNIISDVYSYDNLIGFGL
jgi:hypothetical protein